MGVFLIHVQLGVGTTLGDLVKKKHGTSEMVDVLF